MVLGYMEVCHTGERVLGQVPGSRVDGFMSG